MPIKNKYLFSLALLAGVAGCKQVPMMPGLSAHKIDIQQGNAVTQEMVAKLQPGMTRSQVRFALGTPLLVDPFRGDRWDYFYSYMKGGVLIEERRLVVFFKDDKLDRMEGDVIAKPATEKGSDGKNELAKPAAAAAPAIAKPVAVPESGKSEAANPSAAAASTANEGVPVGSGASVATDKPVAKPEVKVPEKPAEKAAAKPAATKPEVKAQEKPPEERGFFGRMLEKIGL